MLGFSEDLKLAYRLKELFYCVPCGYQYVLTKPIRVRATKSLREWIKRAEESNLKEFKSCTTAFNKWFDEICNSFDYPWSNGPLEGTHTKIKTLKRNCFGMKNFNLFRKKLCLLVSSDKKHKNFAKPLGVLFAMFIFNSFYLF